MRLVGVWCGVLWMSMAAAQDVGVILFEHRDFLGKHEVFSADDPDLRDNAIGMHQASSIRVPPGWSAVLYSDVDYGGASMTLDRDEARLSKTEFGNDRVASIQVRRPERGGPKPEGMGVELFDQAGFRGRSETRFADDTNLKDSIVGNDRLRSLKVPLGLKVTLFEHKDFEGKAEVFLSDDDDLADNPIGIDSVSSFKIEFCDAAVRRVAPNGAVLFEHENFEGRSEPFFSDDDDLRDNLIGRDEASSIQVPQGLVVTLYARPEFKGKSIELRGDLWDLGQTKLGNDKSGSLKVRAEGNVPRAPGVPVVSKPAKPSRPERPQRPRQPKAEPPPVTQKKPPVTSPPPAVDPGQVAVILFSEMYFGGTREELSASDADLTDNPIFKEGVRSMQVLAGFKVTLFDGANFQGKSESFTFDDADLSDNAVGGRAVTSVKIERTSL